jgi:hypothetical protein
VPGKDVHIPIQTGDPVKSVSNHRRFSSQFNKYTNIRPIAKKINHVGAFIIKTTCSYITGLRNPKKYLDIWKINYKILPLFD